MSRCAAFRTTCCTWGDPAAPKLFLLHGWMDVAASFQFLVDALARDWYVMAPDRRGFGRSEWQPQGYWFADYVADLEALARCVRAGRDRGPRRSQPRRQRRHDLRRRASRARAARRLARRLRHSGRGRRRARRRRSRSGSTRSRDPPEFAPYANLDAVADRLAEEQSATAARQGRVPRRGTGRRRLPTERARLRVRSAAQAAVSDDLSRSRKCSRCGATITAPTLWVAAADSAHPAWLDDHPEGEAATDELAACGAGSRTSPMRRLVVVPDAAHMLHHDQPEAVARSDRSVPRATPAAA